MTAQHRLESSLRLAFDPQGWNDLTVIVAVSGGPDSVALLLALHRLRLPGPGRLIAAHFNHGLRESANADQQFVQELADRLKMTLEIGAAKKPTYSRGDGLEAAAREARYDFLKSIAGLNGARYVLTGHNRDDQVETVLQRILRGTSLRGLAGIPQARTLIDGVGLCRPLLAVPRDQILDYLKQHGQAYCVDETNAQTTFQRNRVRHELLPLLEKDYQPTVKQSLLRLSRLAEESCQVLNELVAATLPEVAECHVGSIRLRRRALAALHPHLARLVLIACWKHAGWSEQDMTMEKWEALRNTAASAENSACDVASFMLPGSVRISQRGEWTELAVANRCQTPKT